MGNVTLVDPRGNPIRATADYQAASHKRRLSRWNATSSAINTLVSANLTTLRNRSRDLIRNDCYASAGLDEWCSKTIGTGITVECSHPDTELCQLVDRKWHQWQRKCDADGVLGFSGMQELVTRSLIESGETLVRVRPRRKEDGLPVPFQLQLMEPDHLILDEDRNFSKGNRIRCGIETDGIGKRVAYHLYRDHPGDNVFNNSFEKVRVPANEIFHIFKPVRIGQLRGLPKFVIAMLKLQQLDLYDDAELQRKIIAAMFAGFITREDEGSTPGVLASGEKESSQPIEGVEVSRLEGGSLTELGPGEDIKFSEPADVGGGYEMFQYRVLLSIAASLGMSYADLTGDLRQVNYSSIRYGMLNTKRKVTQFQTNIIIHQFILKTWETFIDYLFFAGDINADVVEDLKYSITVIPPRWEWVDPLKEVNADILEVRAGIDSLDNKRRGRGNNPKSLEFEIKAGQDRADSLGLVYSSNARDVSNAGVGQDGRSREAQSENEVEE